MEIEFTSYVVAVVPYRIPDAVGSYRLDFLTQFALTKRFHRFAVRVRVHLRFRLFTYI